MAEKARFIYKPIEITRDRRLTATMQDYLCLIAQLQNAGGCTASNSWFAEYFGVSRNGAVGIISKLKDDGFIESEILERQGKKITLRVLSVIDKDSKQSLLTDSKQSLPTDSKQSLPRIVSSAVFDSKQSYQVKTKEKTKGKEYSPNSHEFRLSKLLQDLILERKPDCKKKNLQEWAQHIDRMIRLDSRKPERIEEVIRWCQADSFWQINVRSTEKLRQQFDQLEEKMEENNGKSTSGRKNRDFANQTSRYGGRVEL